MGKKQHIRPLLVDRTQLQHEVIIVTLCFLHSSYSVIFVNENENKNGEKRENNEFVNEN